MKRQGYDVSIGDHGGQWIAVFYDGHRGYEALNAAGDRAGCDAVARGAGAAWDALTKTGCTTTASRSISTRSSQSIEPVS